LRDGRFDRVQVAFDEDARWLTMVRAPIAVAVNLGASAQPVPLSGVAGARLELRSHTAIRVAVESVELPPDSVAIVRLSA
jgi:hypothetical protein